MPPRPTPQKNSAPNFSPSNLAEAMAFADMLAKSSMVPKDYAGNPGNILVAMTMGAEVGLKPVQSLLGIAIIEGRPGIWGDAFWALILAHPEFDGATMVEDASSCTVTLARRGKGSDISKYSLDDAAAAGLLGKDGPWQTNPKRMLMIRARTFAGRNLFADALCGITTIEELHDQQASPRKPVVKAIKTAAAPLPLATTADASANANPTYSTRDFSMRSNEWKTLVQAGLKTPDDLIAMLETKKGLTGVQRNIIHSWALPMLETAK